MLRPISARCGQLSFRVVSNRAQKVKGEAKSLADKLES